MKKNDLKRYQKQKQLIAAYQAELDGGLETGDSVQGSARKLPYNEHVIPIHGRDIKRERWLKQRIGALNAQCARAEAFVAGVSDEHMRAFLYWHYIRGRSWPKVRKILGVREISSDCLRKRADTFLRENN